MANASESASLTIHSETSSWLCSSHASGRRLEIRPGRERLSCKISKLWIRCSFKLQTGCASPIRQPVKLKKPVKTVKFW